MKTSSVLLASAAALLTLSGCQKKEAPTSRIDDLMSRMTLEEKLGQLNLLPGGDITTGAEMNSPIAEKVKAGQLGSILNVKGIEKIRELQRIAVEESRMGIPLIIGQDVIHGYETVLPLALAQACSWDTALIRTCAAMAAEEATASGVNWVYSPMVDVSVDPRWGRVSEGAGEDPFLAGEVGAAMIAGYQGPDPNNISDHNVMACVKHYALYGASEAGRDYNMVDMSRARMFNQYFPPYKRCVDAGAGSFMTSFNLVDGIPATANEWLVNEILRRQWGFEGFVVTDYASISEMLIHGVGDPETNAWSALAAGTDMDMCSEYYVKYLNRNNLADYQMEEIDQACRRVLEAKEKLGLFDDPYRYCNVEREKTDLYTPEHRALARKMATETFVLLKNEGDLLPLKEKGTIALIGPLANTRNNLPGSWSTGDKPEKYTTLLEAMRSRLEGKANILYSQGSNIYDSEKQQHEVEFGRPIDRVDKQKALNEALNIARKADVVVLAIGEMAEMSGESSSRSDLTMPDAEKDLMEAIVKTGKPVVLLNYAGRPTVLSWEKDNIDAILNVWFAGSETGDAICDVLFGDVAPSGKTVNSFPQNVGQIPIYYNHTNTGRPVEENADQYYKYRSNYMDVRNEPLYPFGFGLSYTTFEYSDVTLSKDTIPSSYEPDTLTASVTVTNTGKMDADEVVQLYIRDVAAFIARPVKELKGFRRIHLKAGESQKVEFTITSAMLDYADNFDEYCGYNNSLSRLGYNLEPGDFVIMVGPNSANVKSAKLYCK